MKQLYRYRHFAHTSYDLLAKDRTHIEHTSLYIHAGIAVDTCCNRGPWRCGEIDLQQVSYWPS